MDNISSLDKHLMSQFVADSMISKGADIPSDVEFDNDFSIASLQQQAPIWCIRAKGLLLSNIAEPRSLQGFFITSMKRNMIKDYRNNKAMSYLYDCNDINTIVLQISMLAMHSLYKNVEDIYNIDDEIQRQALNPESVCAAIGLYTYFTLQHNSSFNHDQFDDIFIRSWFCYYSKWQVRLIMFKMNGNAWKDSFKGVLMD